MLNVPKLVHVSLGLSAVVVACGGTTSPLSTNDKISAPASEDPAGEPHTPLAPPAVERGGPPSASPEPEGEHAAVDACADMECPGGYCDLQTVQCVRAPCPPVASCVSGVHPCAATTCPTNTRCESHDGKGVCVPLAGEDGAVSCGKTTCASGQVCCNPSCGICTAPGDVCTQQACL